MKRVVQFLMVFVAIIALVACKKHTEEELSQQKEVTFFNTMENPFLKEQSLAKENVDLPGYDKAVELLKKSASAYDEKKKIYTGFEEKGKQEFTLGSVHWDISYKDDSSTKLLVQDIQYTNQGNSTSIVQFVYSDCFLVYQGEEGLPKKGDIILESTLPKGQLKIANNGKFSDNATYSGTLLQNVSPGESFNFQVGYELKNKKDPIYQIIVSRIKLEKDACLKVIQINKIEVE